MANTQQDFTSILLRRGIISPEQLEKARALSRQEGNKVQDALVRLGDVTAEQVMRALAESHGLQFVDLTEVTIPPAVIELIPESVAREIVVLPLCQEDGLLRIAISDPADFDTIQKLQFILNKDIQPVLAVREQLIEAINRHYGQTETEYVDSMLAEFTDTAIDFTETGTDFEASDLHEEALGDDEAMPGAAAPESNVPAAAPADVRWRRASPFVERQATVRYYHRMNPERMFPLLVVLSKKAVLEVARRGVSQARSGRFQVEADSLVEVEPILPGCACYPPKEHVAVRQDTVTVTFWVVPHVLGKIMHARVVVRQEGRVLAEVPLEACVVKQTLTVLLGGLSLLLPLVLLLLKHFRLDFESQLDDGFGLYAQATGWALRSLSPEVLCGLLLASAVAAYFWLRPRKRDVFWDVQTAGPEKAVEREGVVYFRRDADAEPAAGARRPRATVEYQSMLLARAEEDYRHKDYTEAQRFYDSALALDRASALVYHHASLAAHLAGHTTRALAILKEAETTLGDAGMRGPMWYNLGCFATRLGYFDDAVHYLGRAVERGCTDVGKYQSDPDLAPLRWRADFKQLLRSLRAQAPC
jgi:hypothetical protein